MARTLNYYLIALFLILLSSCKSENKQKIDLIPEMELKTIQNIINNPQTAKKDQKIRNLGPIVTLLDSTYNFGTINQGDIITHSYNIKNSGRESLRIFDTKTTCGCTVAEFSKEPIKPNESRKIVVNFDSKHKKGKQLKIITLVTNAYPSEYKLEIKGTVTPKQ